MPPPIETFELALPNGIRLSCRACGPQDAPRIVLLHGFPEAAFVWDDTMAALGDQWRCIAPNLRGYERSSAPPEVAAYHPRVLAGDVAALIEATGGPVELLVAHDWGGALAWNLAAQQPQWMKRLMLLNSPHPATFLRALQHDSAQQQASQYMNALREPGSEQRLAENDFAALWPFFGDAAWLSDALKERYRELWRRGLTGPVNYYRASPLRPPTPDDRSVLQLALPPGFGFVALPTLLLWGEADHALLPVLLQGLEAYLPRGEIVREPDATHWIVHERPALVRSHIERWLRVPP